MSKIKGGEIYTTRVPLRPRADDSLFPMEDCPVIIKGQNKWERYREEYGTPPTNQGPSAVSMPDVKLTLRSELVKGSLVGTLCEETSRFSPPDTDPPINGFEDPNKILKSFLEWPDKED